MTPMRFDCRDLFKAARLAFSFQRLWIQFLGMAAGYGAYVILTYLSLILAGQDLSVIVSRYGIMPAVAGFYLPWYSWIVFGLGVFVLVLSVLVTSTAVARAVYMNLKGNTFYTWKEAFMFALKKKGASVLGTPVAILLIALFTALGGLVVALLARIPVVGPLGLTLLTPIWFFAALFLVFVILALAVSLLLTPSILATTDDDAFEGIFQSFSVLHGQPWRFLFYEIMLVLISVISLGVFAFFAKQAWVLLSALFSAGMGDAYLKISFQATYLLQHWVYPAVAWSKMLLGQTSGWFFFARDFTAMNLSGIQPVAAGILAFFLLVICLWVAALPLAVFNAGNSIIFLILKKIKDDDNLLERQDREEEDEEEEEVAEAPVPEAKSTES